MAKPTDPTNGTLKVAPRTHSRLKDLSKAAGIPLGELGTHLLDHCLDKVDSGALRVEAPKRVQLAEISAN